VPAGSSTLLRHGHEPSGEADRADVELKDRPLGAVYAAFDEAISRGLAHLTAEDHQLDGRFVTIERRRRVNFGSCSYLGLETDRRLKNSACEAVLRYGVQFSSSRAYVSCPLYGELERLLGAMFEAPLVVAPTATLAHHAALPVVVRPGDAVLCDQLVHQSVQGVLPTLKAQGTRCRFVRHNRLDRLEQLVADLGSEHERVWYLADGIYSMHGDTAPVADLHALASRRPQLHLYIDDSHGLGWKGTHGRGQALGAGPILPRTVVVVGFAKSFAAGGAAVVFSDESWSRTVRLCGGPMIFSGPLQPPVLGAAIASARVHLSSEIYERQKMLLERIRLFNTLAEARHIPLATADETPIRFVATGSNEATYGLCAALMEDGYLTNAAVFPAVSKGRGGLRITLTVHQTHADIWGLVDAIARRL
jgi:7-keto-8-aminopelargonate synthetase-like enzyme